MSIRAAHLRVMAIVGAFALCVPIVADAQGKKKNDGGNDIMKIQGVWMLESRELNGQLADARVIGDMRLEIDAKGVWLLSFGPGKPTNRALVFIDASKNPKVMEVRGPKGKVHWSGIYKVDGDTLMICRPARLGGDRPKAFKSSADDMLWVWKRAAK